MKRIKEAIEQNRYITFNGLVRGTNIPRGSIERIIKNDLDIKKLKSVWVLKELSDEQKEQRVKWCQEQLTIYDNGNHPDVKYIITGDETWMMFKTVYSGNKKRWVFGNKEYHKLPKIRPTMIIAKSMHRNYAIHIMSQIELS